MDLGASIDYNSFSIYQEDVDNLSSVSEAAAKRWVIQTKWETPVFDFSNAKAEITTVNQNGTVSSVESSTSFWKERDQANYYRLNSLPRAPENNIYLTSSRGMWHQSGEKIVGNKGYVMTLDDVEGYFSLGKKVNLLSDVERPKRSARIGAIKRPHTVKDISEAVVAIPFYYESQGTTRKFFDIRTEYLAQARHLNDNLENLESDSRYLEYFNDPGSTPVESAAYQLRMLQKYVFPPKFDYLKFGNSNSSKLPFMFIFQFNANFDQDDLVNIWQNVMPSSKESGANARFSYNLNDTPDTVTDTKYISLFLDNNHNYPISDAENFIKQKVRWLVFKVKQRAKVSMTEQKESSLPEVKRGAKLINSSFRVDNLDFDEEISDGSYNWPYDYFSIVELIKIGAKTDYKSK